MKIRRRWIWYACGLALLAAGSMAVVYLGALLDRLAPLELGSQPSLLTSVQLVVLQLEPERCFNVLDRSKVEYRRAPVQPTVDGCGYDHAVFLTHSDVSYGGRVLLRCPAMVSLLLWERHVVEPAAQQQLGQRVTGVHQLGTYSCRNINHARIGQRSQHALANAIDIAAFRTEDGTSVSVAKDWGSPGPRGLFLKSVHDGACRFFGVVLSPDYDTNHRDHFHFDNSGWSLCR